ncbi:Uncharacterised protein [Enterobacter cloacae]|nr:Uncharacterised protein [Enterobacter cloacae]
MRPFNAAFGSTGFCTNGLNVQFMHRTAKLGIAVAAGCIFIVDPEYAGFVAVQRKRFAMFFNIAPGRFKIGESRLRFHEKKLH